MIKFNIPASSYDKKQLLSNFTALTALQAAAYILPLLTLPYLVKVLGLETFGLVMFAQAFIIYFSILVDYGFDLSATREISQHRDDQEKLVEIYSSVMTIRIVLMVISFVILLAVVFLFNWFRDDWKLYFLTFGMVVGQALFPVWYFQGIERMKYITIVNILAKAIFTVMIFIVVKSEDDYLYVPIVNSLGMFVATGFSLWIIHKKFRQVFSFQKPATLLAYFKDSTQFFLSRVSVSIYTASNVVILGLVTNTTMVGHYSIAEKLYKGLRSIYAPVVTVLYPYISNRKNINLFKVVFKFITTGNLFFVALLALSSQMLFNTFFGSEYELISIDIFYIFLLASLVVIPSIMLGYPFLAALGHPQKANSSVIAGSIVHLIGLGLLLVFGIFSVYSITFMVVFTESLILVLRIIWIRRFGLWRQA
ncbi:oligosaccharide flippase family protein [Gemmatimonadota bacterium]